MLKKSGIMLMTLLYLFTASGIALNFHYCNNTIADVSINAPAEDCFSHKGGTSAKPMAMSKNKMDCRNSHFLIKVKDDHHQASVDIHSGQVAIGLPVVNLYDQLFTRYPLRTAATRADHIPPYVALKNVPAFLKNCIFRI